jgi:hypothetical protein
MEFIIIFYLFLDTIPNLIHCTGVPGNGSVAIQRQDFWQLSKIKSAMLIVIVFFFNK